MQVDIKTNLSYRLHNAQLQQKLCTARGQNPHRISGASRLQSTGPDVVVNLQDSAEARPQDADVVPAAERDSSVGLTRRDLIRGLVAGTVVTSTPAFLPASQAPVAEANAVISRLPPIRQAAPGAYNIGMAAVRDPGLYRWGSTTVQSLEACVQYYKLTPTLDRGMATDQAVRSELQMHGLMPHRHVPLQVEIDRADGALQACNTPLEKYKVVLHAHLAHCCVTLWLPEEQPQHSRRACLAGLGYSA